MPFLCNGPFGRQGAAQPEPPAAPPPAWPFRAGGPFPSRTLRGHAAPSGSSDGSGRAVRVTSHSPCPPPPVTRAREAADGERGRFGT